MARKSTPRKVMSKKLIFPAAIRSENLIVKRFKDSGDVKYNIENIINNLI